MKPTGCLHILEDAGLDFIETEGSRLIPNLLQIDRALSPEDLHLQSANK
jgi:hypothetical protein